MKKLDFFSLGKQLIVFSIEANPCQYSAATIDGFGLSDNNIIGSFARMVRRKLQTCNQLRESWSMSINDIENFVQRGLLPEFYNAIYATINPSFKVHSTGYAVTHSHQSATKIWSIASDGEYLVTTIMMAGKKHQEVKELRMIQILPFFNQFCMVSIFNCILHFVMFYC